MRYKKIALPILTFGLLLVTSLVWSKTQPSRIYKLDLSYRNSSSQGNGSLWLKEIQVIPGYAPDRRVQPAAGEGWTLEIDNFASQNIYSFRFAIPSEILPVNITGNSGPKKLSKVDFTLTLPYIAEGRTLKIFDPGNALALEKDISGFSQRCLKYQNSNCQAPPEGINWLKLLVYALVVLISLSILIIDIIILRKENRLLRRRRP